MGEKSNKEKSKCKEVQEKDPGSCETVQYSLRSPKKGKDNGVSDTSPKCREKSKNLREDCKKPRFTELTEAKIRERSGHGPREVVEWLRNAWRKEVTASSGPAVHHFLRRRLGRIPSSSTARRVSPGLCASSSAGGRTPPSPCV